MDADLQDDINAIDKMVKDIEATILYTVSAHLVIKIRLLKNIRQKFSIK
jgi:hypothetical protein